MAGCGQKSSPPQKPQTDAAGQKPKAPKSAETILQDINSLIGELDKKNKTVKAPWMAQASSGNQGTQAQGGSKQGAGGGSGQNNSSDQNNQSGSSGQNGTSDSGTSKAQGTGSGQGSQGGSSGGSSTTGKSSGSTTGGAQGMSPAAQSEMQWQKISMSLMDIHRKWNELEPDVIEAGLPASSLEAFENALGRLTQSVAKQKTDESLNAAIDLYDKYTGGISQVFTLSTPPELYQVEYRTMAALAAANRKDWSAASDAISAAMEPWGLLKAQTKKADKKLLGRCDFSMQDLKNAITTEDLDMVMIKGDIAQANLKQLEKSLTGGSQSGGGQSGGSQSSGGQSY